MVQHLSIRVPWHDNDWNGFVCNRPEHNQACRVLKNIAENKDNNAESQCAGYRIGSKNCIAPPCITESGAFMSNHAVSEIRKHPYVYDTHFKHIVPTEISIEPFTLISIPYKWLLKDIDSCSPNVKFCTKYDPKIELAVSSNNWISNGINQKRIFDYFYRDVNPEKSLVVAYAKAVPFVETQGRIIVGIGCVASVGDLCEYNYSEAPDGKNLFRSYLWERKIAHTIRNNRQNGFVFPFDEIRTYLRDYPNQKIEDLVVVAPEEYRAEFSYAAEHLSHDALIQTLNRTIEVLRNYNALKISNGSGASWTSCIEWCEERLHEVWIDRGAYPGLGAILNALGLQYGFDVAKVLQAKYGDEKLWDELVGVMDNLAPVLPVYLKEAAISPNIDIIKDELEDKKEQLKMLSRLTLTAEQAQLLLNQAAVVQQLDYADYTTDIHKTNYDEKILENPYLLFEKTYMLDQPYRFGISQIDLAIFPPEYVADQFFKTDERIVSSAEDKRRLRAITVSVLEGEALKGSSLMLLNDAVARVAKFRSDVPGLSTDAREKAFTSKSRIEFNEEIFTMFSIDIVSESGEHKENALQLKRIKELNSVIKRIVREKLIQENTTTDDWARLLALILKSEECSNDEVEKSARAEKISAIKKMASSQLSVLTGGAGTGKTTTLVALCMNKEIQRGRILILAPTGKARVVLSQKLTEQNIDHIPKTLFQYLKDTSHCNTRTWTYYLSGKKDAGVPDTVIVDECSMLTEEMFAALLETTQRAKRIILVGDPNQLPPIGTGKPFYELVQELKSEKGQKHYARLLVSNRQKQNDSLSNRLDIELSNLFTDDLSASVSEDIFYNIAQNSENIEFVNCENSIELPSVLKDTLAKAVGITDIDTFDRSLGGIPNGDWMNFSNTQAVENWQILTPYRNDIESGTITINAQIQQKFRKITGDSLYKKRRSSTEWNFRFPGTDQICGLEAIQFGEKVINIQNQDRSKYGYQGYPAEKCLQYIANGEIGIVNGFWKYTHIVQFSSQKGYSYNYDSNISESDQELELAYALTVHKAQGSGFKTTVFILLEPKSGIDPFVSREMLYTALSRQSDKVFIIYNKQPSELKKYAASEYSDLAKRKTNLFCVSTIRELKNGWYDSNLIHTTLAGERVRSKSEVIVADLLYNAGVKYEYELPLTLQNGKSVLPDFTITNADGSTVYWEHLGMLMDYGYQRNWERKQRTYAENGITIDNKSLIISKDDPSGAINSQQIQKLIEEHFK